MKEMNFEQTMEKVTECKEKVCDWNPFRHCQASFSDIVTIEDRETKERGRYQLFKSYRTIVALVDLDNLVVYRLGKWSQTTSKQTTQFCNQYCRGYKQIQF